MFYGESQNCGFPFVVIFEDYLGLGILLKLIIDGKSVIGVNLIKWALELLFTLKGTQRAIQTRDMYILKESYNFRNMVVHKLWVIE